MKDSGGLVTVGLWEICRFDATPGLYGDRATYGVRRPNGELIVKFRRRFKVPPSRHEAAVGMAYGVIEVPLARCRSEAQEIADAMNEEIKALLLGGEKK